MKKQINFYSVIIGTELLNGRRKDAHFAFLNEELLKRGWTHKASFVIEDDTKLMEDIYRLIKADDNSVMFSYGGIGATPDDYTREVAAKVFREGKMQYHKKAQELIINQFGDEAYPYRIEMGNLPINAKLLKNVVNNVAGFYLDDRFFFTPGFPSMSQAMVLEALDKHYVKNEQIKYRKTLTAFCGENDLISLMKEIPDEVELSSLPKIIDDKRLVVLSLSSLNQKLLEQNFQKFIDYCEEKEIAFILEDPNQIK
ncbi:molybdopterin-binding protein [Halarcobacter mediterraneus]|uniref:Molybdopterin-binding protein n=1 Tax=Halarcobacter mediterraneus TaxID=2023153 RepID=A0A4Q1B0U1_9BACT|nr:molybdopterin-binding protein [Halarcobacter mediterraneus]RXK12107.1 molybdopterin-binding protein [Halarcobacter mediterraneus]